MSRRRKVKRHKNPSISTTILLLAGGAGVIWYLYWREVIAQQREANSSFLERQKAIDLFNQSRQ